MDYNLKRTVAQRFASVATLVLALGLIPARGALPSEAASVFIEGQNHYFGRGISKDKKKAAELYRKAAELGDSSAQNALAFMLLTGDGVQKDLAEAIKLFSQSATSGNQRAQYQLGQIYSLGRGVDRNYTEALIWYKKAAQQGNSQAQFRIGEMTELGQGTPADPSKAFEWFMQATLKEDTAAAYKIGLAYLDGRGVEKNPALAREWLLKGTRLGHGHGESMFLLGKLYLDGIGGKTLPKEGQDLVIASVSRGARNAPKYLAEAFKAGKIVPMSIVEEYCWRYIASVMDEGLSLHDLVKLHESILSEDATDAVKRAKKRLSDIGIGEERIAAFQRRLDANLSLPKSDQNNPRLQSSTELDNHADSLGKTYVNNRPLLGELKPEIPKIAIDFPSIGALPALSEQQSYHTHNQIAEATPKLALEAERSSQAVESSLDAETLFQEGIKRIYTKSGNSPDYEAAFKLLSFASNKDHSAAKRELAVLYSKGLGTSKSESKAFSLTLESAKSGDLLAQVNLGNSYLVGLGTEVNPSAALKWYTRAADHEFSPAYLAMAIAYIRGLLGEKNEKLGIKYLKNAATLGNSEAHYWLGIFYYEGNVVERDLEEADLWLSHAAFYRFEPAQKALTKLREQTGKAQHSGLDTLPVFIAQDRPKYPLSARISGATGEVHVCFTVRIDGKTERVRAVKATSLAFAEAAVAAVSRWEAKPAMRDNSPTPFRTTAPIVFTLVEN